MNIIDIQDSLKNFSEDQLIKEMQMPSGNAPQFLVLSEIQRRKRVRDDFSKRQAAQEPTVAEEAVAAAGVPVSGIAGMSEAMAPQSAASGGIGTIMPQAMRSQAPPAAPVPDDVAMGMAEGGVIRAQNGLPLGLRQRNPGNIRPGAGFIGESGDGSGYATFGSDDEGLRAIQRLLMTYGDKYDIKTLRQLANRYAPPSDNNPTGNYIDFLSDKTGIGPDDEINLAESGSSIIPAIVGFEQGQQPYSQAQIDRAIRAAGTDDPAKVAEILGKPLSDDILNQRLDQEPDILSSLMGARADDGSSESDKPSEAEIKARVDAMKRAAGLGQYKGTVPNLGGSGVVIQDIDDLAEAAAINAETAQNQIVTSATQGAQPSEIQSLVEDAVSASDKTANIQAQSKDMDAAALEGGAAKNNAKAKKLLDESDELRIIAENSPPSVSAALIKEADQKAAEASALVSKAQDQTSQAADASSAAISQRENKSPDVVEAKTTSDTKTEEKTDDGKDPVDNRPIYSGAATGTTTSLEDEILAMQKRMKKSAESDKWLALAQAGLALMSSKEPTLLGAVGEAGISGLGAMREAESRYQEGVVDLINARAKLAKNKTGMDAGNAVSRLGQIERALGGADGMTLSEPDRQRLLQERLYLQRFINIPEFTAGANTLPATS